MNWQPAHPAVRQLIQALRAETSEFYLVGGAVRDLLLSPHIKVKDLDFVVGEPAIPTARRIADHLGWAFYVLDEGRDIARILFADGGRDPYVCDFSRIRGGSIEADLAARDFTINALALRWNNINQTELFDYCGGAADLGQGLIRRVSETSLAEDAIRILRAPRFAAQLDFTIHTATEAQIRRLASSLQLVSPERLRDELWKALATRQPVHALTEIQRLGLLPHLMPELAATVGVTQSPPHYLNVWEHTLQVVSNAHQLRLWLQGHSPQERTPGTTSATEVSLHTTLEPWRYRLRQLFLEPVADMRTRIDWLLWHALFHDVGKPATWNETPTDAQLSYTDAGNPSVAQPSPADRDSATTRAAPLERTPDAARSEPTRIRFLGHDEVGAQLAQARLASLRFSRQEVILNARVVNAHMRPHHLHFSFPDQTISPRAAYRFYRATTMTPSRQMAGFDTLLLALCDYPAVYPTMPPPQWDQYLSHIAQLVAFGIEQLDPSNERHIPIVDGRLLMGHFNLKPGRHIGEILEYLHEAQVAGDITNVDEALTLAADHLDRRASIAQ